MIAEIQVLKGLPTEQIDQYINKTVYNAVVLTREHTKSANAYPYLTGELMRSEVALPVEGANKEYSLLTGVDYALRVWNYQNVKWTNPRTKPQWYYSIFNREGATILMEASARALKELK